MMSDEKNSDNTDGTEAGMVYRNIMQLILTPWLVPLFFVLWQPRHVERPLDLMVLGGWILLSAGATVWCYQIGQRHNLFGPDTLENEELLPAEDVSAIYTRLIICFVVLVIPAMILGVLGPVLI